ncbi:MULTISPECIES: hypothetical protein [Staphylococcus]|uniref:Uncharacterized protein n=2 Tax=Staphylococcus TaxID=1279 RepID=A0A4Q7CJF2_9STAP|nr:MULTISPECIES: hypothetical protein [Staphylococcus]KOR12014.1 hypothetical protein AMC75_11660 [Staphylococcus carnosus]QPT03553.1 hypothetical protein I6G40_10790 [Staphylococcus carnosus]RZI00023.1 hypothetical protein EIG99_12660 [Staphylococcus condimenti]UQA66276.1 hypothetical protein Sta3580_06825 [Staphylococcus carnosus]UTB78885.1 hypothetical protein A2I62_10090 [Staphylococcus carnosus]
MKIKNYTLTYDNYRNLITIYAETESGKPFSYVFSEDQTVREIREKLIEIANKLEQNEQVE